MQDIRSPLQAQVVQWLVAAGDTVATGDVLVILEAMKMEHEIRSPHAGRLAELYFQVGETVGDGDVLGTLAPLSEAVASAVPDQPQHVEPQAFAQRRRHPALQCGRSGALHHRHGRHRRH